MRKVILLISVLGLLFSCNKSNEQKAKDLVTEYIKKNANDPDSYESIEWGSLKGDSTNFYKTDEYRYLRSKIDANVDSFEVISSRIDSLDKTFNKEFLGYFIQHKFRIKNGFNAKILEYKYFTINKDLDSIMEVGNIESVK
ncbi:Uncharacterised protein [Sphingobacterium multivorum]|uniref:hypothetical protein n=1 Tax=Sphingobacterium multivorum TaxID=28454 RepID=UPI000DFF40DF|nr:hypothetical protein [Sphingobacterium multivorum]QQT43347.1 hypothetical protein I6J00_16505 [Sphingobacterium multivorum]SUI98496.1 Uncharacterised protein [Sphingobacterium multivorum]